MYPEAVARAASWTEHVEIPRATNQHNEASRGMLGLDFASSSRPL